MSIDRVHNASGDDNSEFKGKDGHCKFGTNCVSSPFLPPVSASRNPRQCAPGNLERFEVVKHQKPLLERFLGEDERTLEQVAHAPEAIPGACSAAGVPENWTSWS